MSDKKFKFGDEVRCKSSAIISIGGLFVVRAVYGGNAWIEDKCGNMFIFKTGDLELVRTVPDEVENLLVEYAINHTFKSKIESSKFRECAQIFISLLRIKGL